MNTAKICSLSFQLAITSQKKALAAPTEWDVLKRANKRAIDFRLQSLSIQCAVTTINSLYALKDHASTVNLTLHMLVLSRDMILSIAPLNSAKILLVTAVLQGTLILWMAHCVTSLQFLCSTTETGWIEDTFQQHNIPLKETLTSSIISRGLVRLLRLLKSCSLYRFFNNISCACKWKRGNVIVSGLAMWPWQTKRLFSIVPCCFFHLSTCF